MKKRARTKKVFKRIKPDTKKFLLVEKIVGLYTSKKSVYIQQYIEIYGARIGADEAVRLLTDIGYIGTNNETYQKASSIFANDVYDRLLPERRGQGNKTVFFTSGGTGVGKTTALEKYSNLPDYPIIYDSNLSSLKYAQARIENALKHGYNIEIAYIHRDPIEAFIYGVISRYLALRDRGELPRIFSIDSHLFAHTESPMVLAQLIDIYKDNSSIKIRIIDNSALNPIIKPVSFLSEILDNVGDELLKYKISEAAKKAHPKLSEADKVRLGLLGKSRKKLT